MTKYIKRLILIISAIVALCGTSQAQEETTIRVPDEDDIIHQTLSTTSPYYYTNLMLKYTMGNEPLTDLEYYYLYYGFVYQERYRPFVENRALDNMLDIMSRIDPERPKVGDLEDLIEAGTESMDLDPFNPKMLNMMAFAYGCLDDPHREKLYFDHLNGILKAIESSGTGRKEESPWHILMFSHAYDVVAAKGYAYNESRIISRSVEYVPLLRKTHDNIKGFYFDYSRVYRNKPDDVTIRRDRTWQFNNLKPQEYK